MNIYIYFFASSLILILFYTVSKKVSKFTSLYKNNDDDTPLVGGLGIYFFFSLGLINLYSLNNELIIENLYLLITISGIFLIGIIDDILDLNYIIRLICIYLILIFFLKFDNEFVVYQLYFETFEKEFILGQLSLYITALFIILFINSMNMADGINGNSSIIFLSYIFILFEPDSILNNFLFLIIIPLIIFFIFNIKNKTYMGDSGIYLLSTFIALYTIHKYKYAPDPLSSEKIFMTFMIPGIDMLRLFCTRIYNKKNPFKGDRSHLHHILTEKLSINKSLLIYLILILWPNLIYSFFEVQSYYLIIINILVYSLLIKLFKHNKKSFIKF
tara:strand:+ start:2034 stop:3023 length:990 start_codon:yes stop_codon:yes gene_type:complete